MSEYSWWTLNTKRKTDKFKQTNGHYDASQKKMKNLAEPTDLSDSATKQYVDSSFADCLRLDKQKYDVGGRRLTGVVIPIDDADASNKAFVDDLRDDMTAAITTTEDCVDDEIADVKTEILKTLEDFATTKYVDGLISSSQDDEGETPEYVKKERVDKLEAELDSAKKSFTKKNFVNKPFLETKLKEQKPLFFTSNGAHDDEAHVKFSVHCHCSPGFLIQDNGKALKFPPEDGVWEITVIDMTKSPVDRTIEMKFTGLNMHLAGSEFNQIIRKSGSWTDMYFSRIVPLAANATVRMNFSPANAVNGLDGQGSCKIIIKKYL